jgi:CPA2 family monovalent cation:H+ antiporter-2
MVFLFCLWQKGQHMHPQLLQDLAIIMMFAAVSIVVFQRLNQPVVLGYILVGMIIGPHTPPYALVTDQHTIETLGEIGVVLLMFSLGLHFNLRSLAAVGGTAVVAALLEIVVMIGVGYGIGRAFGWGTMDSLFLGAILSVSSTTIIIKALQGLGKTEERFAKLIFGVLIVEDIAAIALLALLSGIATTGSLSVGNVMHTLMMLSIFLVVVVLLGLLLVPRVLHYVARFKSPETTLVAVLGLCFGVALLAHKFGYSVALGAFLIGAVVSEAREHAQISELVEPVRDMFSAVFFVTVGMLIQPQMILEYALPILVITIAVVVGKIVTCSFGAFISGNDTKTSIQVGFGLSQIGEFSFIIASLGVTLGVTSDFLYPIAVTVSAITTLLTPYLIRSSDSASSLFLRITPGAVSQSMTLYNRSSPDRHPADVATRHMLRRWALQVALNLFLIIALFVTAGALSIQENRWLPHLPAWTGGEKTFLWFAALLLALPLLVPLFFKLRAISLYMAERSLTESARSDYALRALIANLMLAAMCTVVSLLVLGLSWAMLPPWPILVIQLLIVLLVLVLLWRHFVRVYASAQGTLRDVLAKQPEPEAENRERLASLLEAAELATVGIPPGARAVGRLIRELSVRARSGASIVGIERAGTSIINPDPHEELQAGDHVLLIGRGEQLAAATELLTAPATATP